MNVLAENPNKDWREILRGMASATPSQENITDDKLDNSGDLIQQTPPIESASDPLDRFTNFKVN